jgi:hypothetical protein
VALFQEIRWLWKLVIFKEKPRYIRDQLKIIKDHSLDKSPGIINKALDYCLKNRLYGATDFVDSLNHFDHIYHLAKEEPRTENHNVKPLHETNQSVLKTHVEIRDLNIYIEELLGVRRCQQNSNNSKQI